MGVASVLIGEDDARPSPKVARRVPRKSSHFAESFSQIVAVLMRDRALRTLPIGALEWLVLPPLMVGQFAIAHAPAQRNAAKAQNAGSEANVALLPVAVALWAKVSDSLDKRLSEKPAEQPRLRPSDWTSGENIWVLAVGGDPRALSRFLDQLAAREFKGKTVKMRVRGTEGKVLVKQLNQSS